MLTKVNNTRNSLNWFRLKSCCAQGLGPSPPPQSPALSAAPGHLTLFPGSDTPASPMASWLPPLLPANTPGPHRHGHPWLWALAHHPLPVSALLKVIPQRASTLLLPTPRTPHGSSQSPTVTSATPAAAMPGPGIPRTLHRRRQNHLCQENVYFM